MKRKNKKVWVVPVVVMIIIAGIIGYVVVQKGGFGFVFGQAMHCSLTPKDPNCICYQDEEKNKVGNYVQNLWYCENKNKFIDTSVSGWENEFELIAKAKLSELYPGCTSIQCDQGDSKLAIDKFTVIPSNHEDIHTGVGLECTSDLEGAIFSQIRMNLATGNVESSECINYFVRPQTGGIVKFYPMPYYTDIAGRPVTYIRDAAKFGVVPSCGNGGGNAISDYRFVPPEGIHLLSISAGLNIPGTAEVVEFTPNYAVIRVTINCFNGGEMYIFPKFDGCGSLDNPKPLGDEYCWMLGKSSGVPYYAVKSCPENGVYSTKVQYAVACDDSVQPAEYRIFGTGQYIPTACCSKKSVSNGQVYCQEGNAYAQCFMCNNVKVPVPSLGEWCEISPTEWEIVTPGTCTTTSHQTTTWKIGTASCALP